MADPPDVTAKHQTDSRAVNLRIAREMLLKKGDTPPPAPSGIHPQKPTRDHKSRAGAHRHRRTKSGRVRRKHSKDVVVVDDDGGERKHRTSRRRAKEKPRHHRGGRYTSPNRTKKTNKKPSTPSGDTVEKEARPKEESRDVVDADAGGGGVAVMVGDDDDGGGGVGDARCHTGSDDFDSLDLVGVEIPLPDEYNSLKATTTSHGDGGADDDEDAVSSGAIGQNQLLEVASKGDNAMLKAILKQGVRVLYKDINGTTALHKAALHGHLSCLNLLLIRGADARVDAIDNEGCTALHCAAWGGHKSCVQRLLAERSCNVDHRDADRATPLHKAAYRGSSHCVAALIQETSAMNARSNDGQTPMHKACFSGRHNVLQMLVGHGARPNVVDKQGSSPLHVAAMGGHFRCVQILLTAGAHASTMDKGGHTPLHLAAYGGHTRCCQLLFSETDVDVTNVSGATALHFAAAFGSDDVVGGLIDHKADINAQDSCGNTPLHYAATYGNAKAVTTLLEEGADRTIQNSDKSVAKELCTIGLILKLFNVHSADSATRAEKRRSRQEQTNILHRPFEDVLELKDGEKVDRYGFIRGRGAFEPSAAEKRKEVERSKKWVAMLKEWDVWKKKHGKLQQRVYKGIPDAVRGQAWQRLANIDELRNESALSYEELLAQPADDRTDRDIRMDLSRTFPKHLFFVEQGGEAKLYNVLKAYALYNSRVGYVQGMGFIAASLLMYMEECDAFWLLARICGTYGLGEMYVDGLPYLKQCEWVLDHLVTAFCPGIAKHFAQEGLQANMYAVKWFLTLFFGNIPFYLSLRILDIMLLDGFNAVFVFALGLLKAVEPDILSQSFDTLFHYLLFDPYKGSEPYPPVHPEKLIKWYRSQRDACAKRVERLNAQYESDRARRKSRTCDGGTSQPAAADE